MIYLKHNFMKNYMNAAGTGDEQMKADILKSEIAKFIVDEPETVVGLLNKYSTPEAALKETPSTSKLVNLTVNAMYANKSFTKEFAEKMIAKNGEMHYADDLMGPPAPTKADLPKKKIDINKLFGGFSNIVNGIGGVVGAVKESKGKGGDAVKDKNAAKDDILNNTKAITKPDQPAISTMGWVGIGLGVVVLTGFVIYLIKR